ncbi:MAG: hypothetical protein ACRCYP_04890 [Alphaproteobacteria bacterium]
MLLRDRISRSSTDLPETAVEGMENAIAKLSQAAQLPQLSEDRVAHRERLVEAIAPIVVDRTFGRPGSEEGLLDIPLAIGLRVKAIVDAILEAENVTNS